MRLICPNCDAQYEIPNDVMPATGRDVQCSNCGQTWFQHHPDHAPDDEITEEAPDEEVAAPPPPPRPSPPEPQRKQLDPAVADILRQEAEAEKAARQSQQGGLESQPDLGMDFGDLQAVAEAERRALEARDRMARMRGEETTPTPRADDAAETIPVATQGSRRDLLPDIEEINSTLRAGRGATQIEADIESPTLQRKKRGFRTGFLTVFMLFIVLVAIYVAAPRLTQSVPALEGPLANYVALVDQLRGWLDGQIKSLLQSLDSAAAKSKN